MHTARDITGYRRYWAERFGTAPFLPMSREEMDLLGWDSCDVIVVTPLVQDWIALGHPIDGLGDLPPDCEMRSTTAPPPSPLERPPIPRQPGVGDFTDSDGFRPLVRKRSPEGIECVSLFPPVFPGRKRLRRRDRSDAKDHIVAVPVELVVAAARLREHLDMRDSRQMAS